QSPLENLVQRALEVEAILEGSRLALVGVDHDIARSRSGAYGTPLAKGREARTAEAPQSRRFKLGNQLIEVCPTGPQFIEQGIAARGTVVFQSRPRDRLGLEVGRAEHSL